MIQNSKTPGQRKKKYALEHWEVENCLLGVKDKEYAEDKHVVKHNGWGRRGRS